MSEGNEQLPSQPTAAALTEAQPTNNPEETGSTRLIDPNNITYGNIATSEKKIERKEYLESIVTSGLPHHPRQQQDNIEGIEDEKNKNEQHHTTNNIIEAFYNIAWPILESEGGWTMVRLELFFALTFCCLRVFM
jgi:hypothetical protein